jgi:hypothetical protein
MTDLSGLPVEAGRASDWRPQEFIAKQNQANDSPAPPIPSRAYHQIEQFSVRLPPFARQSAGDSMCTAGNEN